MENIVKFITMILIIAMIVNLIYEKREKQKVQEKLLALLYERKFDAFDEVIKSNKTRKLIPYFNIQFMLLNEALMCNDDEKAELLFQQFKKVKLKKAEKEAVALKAFYFYLSVSNYEIAEDYYRDIKQLHNNENIPDLDRINDTYIKKGYAYLDQTLKESKNNPMLLSMIADMYLNKGDLDKQKEYEQKAKLAIEKL